jgi:sphingolipid delta-4 desaturase
MRAELNHKSRRAAILRACPEIAKLAGASPSTAWLAGGAMALQFLLAAALAGRPWWAVLILAYAVGGFIMHCLNCVIHECCHNLVLRRPAANKAFAILASLPGLIPSAVSFRHFHLLHHVHFGVRGLDPDIAPAWEAQLVRQSRWRKLLWVLLLPVTYCVVHPLHVKKRLPIDIWLVANVAAVVPVWIGVLWISGWSGIAYLLLSSYFSVGPHPAGAHILQEHIAFDGGNGKSSYYGPINWLAVNLGYHLEHHDLPNIAGWRLPQVRRLVPQFYDDHYVHESRAAGLWRFVVDPNISLESRPISEIPTVV